MSEDAASVRAAIAAAVTRLAPVSDTARLDAEMLMAHALSVDRAALLVDPDRHTLPDNFATLVARRAAHEPVAYIIGYRDFWTVRIAVGPGALIPRPDSETVISMAADHFAARAPATILDLGTGPGSLLIAALDQWPDAWGIGIDASETALAYARANARANAVEGRASWLCRDWAGGVDGRYDLILCNPPYVEADARLMRDVMDFEPAAALFAGPDGLDAYRVLMPMVPILLNPGGVALFEIGAGQAAAVSAIAADSGLMTACAQDLAGHDRVIACTRD